jgi:hypothetical protein
MAVCQRDQLRLGSPPGRFRFRHLQNQMALILDSEIIADALA